MPYIYIYLFQSLKKVVIITATNIKDLINVVERQKKKTYIQSISASIEGNQRDRNKVVRLRMDEILMRKGNGM